MLNIYSYNISESLDLFNVIEAFFITKRNSVLFLQEIPEKLRDDDVMNIRANGRYRHFFDIKSNGLLVLITNDLAGIGPFHQTNCSRNFQIINCSLGQMVNVHMPGRSTASDRISNCTLLINSLLDVNENIFVVGGDFNDNPFDILMSTKKNWFARRSLKEITKNKGFVNFFWNIVKIKRNAEPRGTIIPKPKGGEPMNMAIFDQIILKPRFVPNVESFGVIQKIGREKVSALNQKYEKSIKGQPHWPVYLSLKGIV